MPTTNPSEWHVGDTVTLTNSIGAEFFWLILAEPKTNPDTTLGESRLAAVTHLINGVLDEPQILDVFFGSAAWGGGHWCPHGT